MAKKPVITAKEAAAMIPNGATIMCGGFLACGKARSIVKELVALGTKDLTLIANDMGRAVGPKGEEFFGIAELIHNHQVKRVIATHVGMTPEVGQQNTEGTLEVNLLPQGTLRNSLRKFSAPLIIKRVTLFLFQHLLIWQAVCIRQALPHLKSAVLPLMFPNGIPQSALSVTDAQWFAPML